ncbi:MAG: hypothetical protein PHV13_02425 [Candidatus ainarchaeum sp.]|nr:hypothetical protein [Candidatus ainarchaeum sp.]
MERSEVLRAKKLMESTRSIHDFFRPGLLRKNELYQCLVDLLESRAEPGKLRSHVLSVPLPAGTPLLAPAHVRLSMMDCNTTTTVVMIGEKYSFHFAPCHPADSIMKMEDVVVRHIIPVFPVFIRRSFSVREMALKAPGESIGAVEDKAASFQFIVRKRFSEKPLDPLKLIRNGRIEIPFPPEALLAD